MKLTEDQATEIVEALLREREALDVVFSDDPLDKPDSEVLLFWILCEVKEDDGVFSFGFDTAPDFLFEMAMVHRGAFDLAHLIASAHLLEGCDLPKALQKFSGGVMRGIYTRPARKTGQTSAKDWLRNELICRYMDMLTGPKFGFLETRSRTTSGGSAADILVHALCRCGYPHVTPDMVWNVYGKGKIREEISNVLGT